MLKSNRHLNIKRNIITGVIIAIPLWITWIVFELIFKQLSHFGAPWVNALAEVISGISPTVSQGLSTPLFHSLIAALFTLIVLYVLGWLTTQVMGTRVLNWVERLIQRIPLVKPIYGAVKKFLSVLQKQPEKLQRVVLIEFPSPDMKTIGLVTRIIKDKNTGKDLAAVYVPTTPNPTSGYLEIVPIENLVETDWTIDEAMAFVISGGALAPDSITYTK